MIAKLVEVGDALHRLYGHTHRLRLRRYERRRSRKEQDFFDGFWLGLRLLALGFLDLLQRQLVPRQRADIDLRRLEDPHDVLVAGEHQDLMTVLLGKVTQQCSGGFHAAGVEVHEHVVQHQRQLRAAASE